MNTDRLLGVVIVLALLILGIIARLFYIQVYSHAEYKVMAERQQIGKEVIRANRGLIYDRNMIVLAFSDPEVFFYVSMPQVRRYKQKDKTSDTLMKYIARDFSAVTKKPAQYYIDLMKSGKNRVLLAQASDTSILRLKEIKRDGVYYEEQPKRFYPYGNLASHCVGYIDKTTFDGKDGIEKFFENQLQGKDGLRYILQDPNGHMISVVDESTIQPQTGNNVILTIDKHIQNFLEEELAKGLDQFGGEYATGIIMNPRTGEIIAMANAKDYNLNSYNNFSDSTRRNHSVSDIYEPGSTWKTIALAGMFDRSLVNETDKVDVQQGKLHMLGADIGDTHGGGILSVREVFTKSSNVGMAKLIQRFNRDEFYNYLRSLGFGNVTGVGLPAESKGVLRKPESWSISTQMTLGYGYGVQVSALQLITAYAAIINGGSLLQPQIVKRIETSTGSVVFDMQPKEIRKVISFNTSKRMIELMKAAVEEGTGKKARISGITVGGKTGTARIWENKSYSNKYNASFVGFFPVENPKYLCLIMVRKPSKGSYYGGDVSAPIFKSVAERIVGYDDGLKIQKKNEDMDVNKKITSNTDNRPAGKTTDSIKYKITRDKLTNKNIMPDVRGMSLRDAIAVLAQLKLSYIISGSQRVVYQSILPGTKIAPGMKCEIRGVDVKQAMVTAH
jgi:cell division protein FtsI/penicillin-binding protein 2